MTENRDRMVRPTTPARHEFAVLNSIIRLIRAHAVRSWSITVTTRHGSTIKAGSEDDDKELDA